VNKKKKRKEKMKPFRFVVCSEYPFTISRLSPDETACTYCGHDTEACKEVTEREWRHYWIGIIGQYPSKLHPAKKSEQIFLPGVR
jgi:hypothetical protein